MKPITYITFLLLFTLISAGCSNTEQAGTAASGNPFETTGEESFSGAGNNNFQLAVGTFTLEDTDYAITAGQAAVLLPLWKAARSLSSSETITAEEFQAIFSQIQDTLTDEQLSAIESIEMTPDLLTGLSERYSLALGPGPAGGFDEEGISPEQQATIEAFRESRQAGDGGVFPGGGPPEDGFQGGGPGGGGFPGGGFPRGGDVSSLPEAQQTAIASGSGRRGFGGGGIP